MDFKNTSMIELAVVVAQHLMHSTLKRKKLNEMPDIEKYVVEQLLKAL